MQQNDYIFIAIEEDGMNVAIPHNQPDANHRTHGIHGKFFYEYKLITGYRTHELKSL